MKKICIKCKKPKSDYHKDKHSSDGFRNICKECAKEKSKEYYRLSDRYRSIVRNSGLKNRFGITNEDYFEMLKDQGGVCGICETLPEDGKYFHIDHDHESGEIRGLLCKNCNHGLGNFRDDVNILKNAIEYLDKNSASNF